MNPNFDVIVVGAGIQGLATVEALRQRGIRRLALVEQFALGHERGSSHGRSRITRSSYRHARYVELMQWVHQQGWPDWEALAQAPLLHKTPGLFFGPAVEDYHQSLQAVPEAVSLFQELSPREARKAFPPFLFPDSPKVLVDSSCALIAAQRTREFLIRQARQGGVDIFEESPVLHWESSSQALKLCLENGTRLETPRLILTAGPWTQKLLSRDLRLVPAHQDVGYFDLPHPRQVGQFPVWVYAAHRSGDSFYGLPEFERPGVKLARHRTTPNGDNPDRQPPTQFPHEVLQDLKEFSQQQWGCRPDCLGYEACLYTNSPEEDFVLDFWPEDPRVILGAGFSGHGFKFAPLVGQVLAGLALEGDSGLPVFEKHRPAFALSKAC